MSRNTSDVNILLVNPWISDFKAYDFWIKPVGLLYVGAVLEHNGYKTRLIDCMDRRHPSVAEKMRFKQDGTGKFVSRELPKPEAYRNIPRKYKIYGIPVEAFMAELDSMPEPDVILVTSIMTYWYPGAHETIKVLKERFPSKPLLLGGIYATLCKDFAEKNSGADIVFEGSDMIRLMDIIGGLTDTIPGFKPAFIDNYPHPAFHHYKKLDYYPILTSRGCPFRCSYCASAKLYPVFIQRNSDDILSEILEAHENFGVTGFALYDDALLVDFKRRLLPVLQEIIRRKLKFHFYTPNGLHARYITPEVAEIMFKSGFDHLRVSLESSDESLLKDTGGKVTVGETAGAVKNLLNAGFNPEQIGIYLMMGIPGQSLEDCRKALDFVKNMGVQIRLSDFSPVPGTADFEKMKQIYGEIIEDPLYQNNAFHHFVPGILSLEDKESLRRYAFDTNRTLLTSLDNDE